jgi:hypothetical protein
VMVTGRLHPSIVMDVQVLVTHAAILILIFKGPELPVSSEGC